MYALENEEGVQRENDGIAVGEIRFVPELLDVANQKR